MIGYIDGIVLSKEGTQLLILPHNAGVGYTVNTPSAAEFDANDNATLIVKTVVRENDISLYGFSDEKAKHIFEQLISVNGIGPRAAVEIMKTIDSADLANAIVDGDANKLSSIKGVGKKTAEKIVFSLREKLQKEYSGAKKTVNCEDADKVIQSLMFLGLTKNEATDMVNQHYDGAKTIEQNIKKILSERSI